MWLVENKQSSFLLFYTVCVVSGEAKIPISLSFVWPHEQFRTAFYHLLLSIHNWFFFISMAVIFFLQDFISIHIIVKDFCFNESDFYFLQVICSRQNKTFLFQQVWFFFLQDFISIYNTSELVCCHDRVNFFCKPVDLFTTYKNILFTYVSDFFLQTWYIIAELFLFPRLLFYFLKDYISINTIAEL